MPTFKGRIPADQQKLEREHREMLAKYHPKAKKISPPKPPKASYRRKV